ncbi:MAG: sialate O-acetylesterase [Planctomycetota bacterium]|jgi:sialate O-acetylesterase
MTQASTQTLPAPRHIFARSVPPVRRTLGAVACVLAIGSSALAQLPKEDVVEVPAIADGLCVSQVFQSNMVIQRDKPITVWGWAAPGEEVTVTFGDETSTAVAGKDRRWSAELAAAPAATEPQAVTVRGATDTLRLDNVLVGDVWLLGGQSNMEFEVAKVENGALEIASANYPLIRILTVPYGVGPETQQSFARLDEWSDWFGRHFRKGDWDVCSPKVVSELSAVGYAFARRVHMASGVPIGVIDASRGGTAVETWLPQDTLRGMEGVEVQGKLAEWDAKVAAWDSEAGDKPTPLADMNYPGNGYAGMLGPLIGLQVKGAIFHQGYNNALDGTRGVRMYRDLFPKMIAAWRKAFADPELPFGILSQCTDGYPQTADDYLEKMLNAGIHIRAEHYRTFLELRDRGDEHVGFASSYDLRRRWYHPQVKIPAGERLARWALSTQYGFGRKLLWEPPKLISYEGQDGALLLRLNADVSDPEDGEIVGFAIAGSDRKFQPASAAYLQVGENDRGQPKFDRKQLLLTSPLVAEPIHFRYAWGRNPLGNLQVTGNKDLPFATQRSDDWDMGTVPLGVLDEEIDGKLSRAQRNRVLQALRKEDERRRTAEAREVLGGR